MGIVTVTVTVAHSTPRLSEADTAAHQAEETALAHRVAAAHPAEVSSGTAGKTTDLIAQSAANPVIAKQRPDYVEGFRLAMGLAALAFGAGALVAMTVPSRRSETATDGPGGERPR